MLLLAMELKGYHDIAMVILNLTYEKQEQYGASTKAYGVTFELKHKNSLV